MEISFKSLKQALADPLSAQSSGMLETPDMNFWGRSDQLHVGLVTIFEFLAKEGRLPQMEDANSCWELAQSLIKNKTVNLEVELEEEVIKNCVSFSRSSISPMSAFFGGIIA